MWKLVGVEGVDKDRCFILERDRILVGNQDSDEFRIVSRERLSDSMAELILTDDACVFRPLGDFSITVNGLEFRERLTLDDQDVVQIGDSVFRCEKVPDELADDSHDLPHFRPLIIEYPEDKTKTDSTAHGLRPQVDEAAAPTEAVPRIPSDPLGVIIREDPSKRRRFSPLMLAIYLTAVSALALYCVWQVRRTNEARRLANTAISSLRDCCRAAQGDMTRATYVELVREAESRVSAYHSKFKPTEFDAVGLRMLKALQAHEDAVDLWSYKAGGADTGGRFLDERGNGRSLFQMCRNSYPETMRPLTRGGCSTSAGGRTVISADAALKLIWMRADESVSALRFPD